MSELGERLRKYGDHEAADALDAAEEALSEARDAIRCSNHCVSRIDSGCDCDCGADRIRSEADAALNNIRITKGE